jgi:hypothetical protein
MAEAVRSGLNGRVGASKVVKMKRLRFRRGGIPVAEYDRVRFHVGLAPKVNHSDPAQYGAQDSLNPVLNGRHWSWRDGYVFFALEGKWLAKSDSSSQSGYSYHLGNDQMFTVVEIRGDIATSNSGRVELVLNLDSVFGGEGPLKIDAEKTSTHARGNDPLAEKIRGNLRGAFSIRQVHEAGSRTTDAELATAPKKRVLIAADATPYRFTYGRHFPAPGLPLDNPLTEEGVGLGLKGIRDDAIRCRCSIAPGNGSFFGTY